MLSEELGEEFHDVIRNGDAKNLASLLRKLPQLEHDVRDVLADLLGGGTFARKFYPYQLKLAPRAKHKPNPPLPDNFTQAVFRGDAQQLAGTLLGPTDFEADRVAVLADLLDADATGHKSYPYRLEFGRWGRGQPVDFLKKKAASFTRVLMFHKELETEKKHYLAVENVKARTGRGRSTIMNDLAKVRKSRQRQLQEGE